MNSKIILNYGWQFLAYLLVQVMVLNYIDFMGVATPYLFVLFLITLPTEISTVSLMLIAFVMGLIVDVCSDTVGVNAFACVLMSYLKPRFCKLFAPADAGGEAPSFPSFGKGRFFQFALLMVLVHHFCFYLLENGTLIDLGGTLFKAFESSVITMVLICCIEYFKYRHNR